MDAVMVSTQAFFMNINISLLSKLINTHKDVRLLCSGGVDSIAGTHYLIERKHLSNKNVSVVHVNHGLRKQNDIMEESVVSFCSDYGYTLEVYHINKTLTTEADFRKERLKIYETFDPCCLVSFHHLDDCVESHFLNFIRGHTDRLPIPPITPLIKTGSNIVHPFILNKKNALIQYAQRKNLMKYVVEDETNKIVKGSRRNLIRNQIIPILSENEIGLDTIVKKLILDKLENDLSFSQF